MPFPSIGEIYQEKTRSNGEIPTVLRKTYYGDVHLLVLHLADILATLVAFQTVFDALVLSFRDLPLT
jgi:hypothetical protein